VKNRLILQIVQKAPNLAKRSISGYLSILAGGHAKLGPSQCQLAATLEFKMTPRMVSPPYLRFYWVRTCIFQLSQCNLAAHSLSPDHYTKCQFGCNVFLSNADKVKHIKICLYKENKTETKRVQQIKRRAQSSEELKKCGSDVSMKIWADYVLKGYLGNWPHYYRVVRSKLVFYNVLTSSINIGIKV
jgi:hypothetical protein